MRTLVLCGGGNNGGDGYVAARFLQDAGWPVVVAPLAPPRPGSAAALAAAAWTGPVRAPSEAEIARAELVIDAVFGAGLSRPVEAPVAALLAAARRLVAIDLPSGIDGATGAVLGAAPHAELTVTFFRLKPGHLLLPGRLHCGRIELAEIGLPAGVLATIRPNLFVNVPALWSLPVPEEAGNKYSRGHLTVLGGAEMTGAARLAASAARRAGAGLVTIAVPPGVAGLAGLYRSGAPGLLVSDAPLADLLADGRRRVFVCGPGLGAEAARMALRTLIQAGRMVVADADVFTAYAGQPDGLRGATVLTPHGGEFARCFGAPGPDRVAAVRAAAARTGAVVVLKGADTVIAAPDGTASINANAPPSLATAGAGDVLAGIIGALLLGGMEAWEAASAGVWLHGAAAALASADRQGLIAEDLLPMISAARA